MKTIPKFHLHPRLIRWASYVIGVILILALVSWLFVPSFLKNTLEQQTAAQIGRQLTISKVAFNPFTLKVELSDIVLLGADKKSTDFSADQLIIKISPMSIFHFAPVMREVVLQHPYLNLVRMQVDGKEATNFSDVIARLAARPSSGESMRYSVSNIQIANGAVRWNDQVVGKDIQIEAINVGLPFVSNFSSATDTFIEPGLSAKLEGTVLELKGRSKPFAGTHETSLEIKFNRLDLVPLLAFSPKPVPFKVNSALFNSDVSLNFFIKNNVANVSLTGKASIDNLALSDLSGAPLLNTKAIHVNMHEVNLTTEKIALNLVEIDEPQLWAGLNQHGILNWATMQTDTSNNQPTTKKTAVSTIKPVVQLTQFILKNGTVHWSDAANATPTMEMQVSKLNVDAQKISTDEKASPFALNMSAGEESKQRVFFKGSAKLSDMALNGHMTFSDVALADYQPYVNRYLAAKVSGKLALETQVEVKHGHVKLNALGGTISSLKLQPSNREVGDISANKIGLEKASINEESKLLIIEKLVLDHIQGNVARNANGDINLSQLMVKSSAGKATNKVSKEQKDQKDKGPSWQAQINHVALTDSNLNFTDQTQKPAVSIRADALEVQLGQVSSKLDRPMKVMVRTNLNKAGKVAVDGVVDQKSTQLDVELQNFSVLTLQPYFTQYLNTTVERGTLSTKGKVNWTAPEQVSYQGELQVVNFSSSDKGTSDAFLRWKSLGITGIDASFGAKPPKITLGKVNLSDFYARAILSEQGHLNLQTILVSQQNASTSAPANTNTKVSPTTSTQANAPVIKIGQVNLNNGVVNYTDNFIKPHFSMRMTGMKGTVGTIQSSAPKAAPVNLTAKVENNAPIVISGSLNPLFKPMLLDIKMTANGIDLPPLSTYSAKYAGYPIERGKLSLDVEYHIKDNQLTANNSLKIDQLTFGNKVDSPDATSLPVLLAVDLLTDKDGRINLDVPISGTLDDPHFSVGAVIAKFIANLIGKVITAPFALLAHSFSGGGGAEQLSYVEFASGSAKLTDAIKVKLDNLAKALEEHPKVTLDIIGRSDMDGDTPGLRELKLNRQVRKMNYLKEDESAAGGPGGPGGAVSEADRAQAVAKIYLSTKGDKPKNAIGLPKTIPTAEMEEIIKKNTAISDDDLQALATRRASVVRTYLIETAHVAPERIYTIAPKTSGADIKDKGSVSRVDFDLKM